MREASVQMKCCKERYFSDRMRSTTEWCRASSAKYCVDSQKVIKPMCKKIFIVKMVWTATVSLPCYYLATVMHWFQMRWKIKIVNFCLYLYQKSCNDSFSKVIYDELRGPEYKKWTCLCMKGIYFALSSILKLFLSVQILKLLVIPWLTYRLLQNFHSIYVRNYNWNMNLI